MSMFGASAQVDAPFSAVYCPYCGGRTRRNGRHDRGRGELAAGAVLRNHRGPEWGDRAVWEDLHHRDPCPFWLD